MNVTEIEALVVCGFILKTRVEYISIFRDEFHVSNVTE